MNEVGVRHEFGIDIFSMSNSSSDSDDSEVDDVILANYDMYSELLGSVDKNTAKRLVLLASQIPMHEFHDDAQQHRLELYDDDSVDFDEDFNATLEQLDIDIVHSASETFHQRQSESSISLTSTLSKFQDFFRALGPN